MKVLHRYRLSDSCLIFAIIIVLTLLSCAIILYVCFGIGWPVAYINKSKEVNEVLLQLSYSYLAGIIVFLLTNIIPYQLLRNKLHKPIEAVLINVKEKYHASAKCIMSVEEYSVPFTREKIVSSFASKSYRETCDLGKLGINKMPIIDCLIHYDNEAKILIQNALSYKKYLPTQIIIKLEELRSGEYSKLLVAYKTVNQLDNCEQRSILGNSIMDQYELAESLLKHSTL